MINQKLLLLIYISYIYDLKKLIIEKKKIPLELIDAIIEIQFIIKNYDSFMIMIEKMMNQLGKKENMEKIHSKDEYFKQISKDYFHSNDYAEENRIR